MRDGSVLHVTLLLPRPALIRALKMGRKSILSNQMTNVLSIFAEKLIAQMPTLKERKIKSCNSHAFECHSDMKCHTKMDKRMEVLWVVAQRGCFYGFFCGLKQTIQSGSTHN